MAIDREIRTLISSKQNRLVPILGEPMLEEVSEGSPTLRYVPTKGLYLFFKYQNEIYSVKASKGLQESNEDLGVGKDAMKKLGFSDNVLVDTSELYRNIKISASQIGSNIITANNIATNAVTAGKINTNAVTSGSIATSAVTSGKIADGAITAGKIGNLEITAAKIANLTITASQLANLTINGSKIADHGIDGTDKIVADSITAASIASDTITASEIASDTITASQIASNTITASEMNVSSLSALSANMGTITSGSINIGSGKAELTSGGNAIFASGAIKFDSNGNVHFQGDASAGGVIYFHAGNDTKNYTDSAFRLHHNESGNVLTINYDGSNKFLLENDGDLHVAGGFRFGDIGNNDIGFDQNGGNSISVQMNVNGSSMMPAVHASGSPGSNTVGYDLGKSTQKWRKVWGVDGNFGDLIIDNQVNARWILREQPDCILARNCKTKKTFKLDMTETSDYNDELWEDEQSGD